MEETEATDTNLQELNKSDEETKTETVPNVKVTDTGNNVADAHTKEVNDSDSDSENVKIEGIYNKTFRPFTKKSYERLLLEERERECREKKKSDGDEGRLVDGEIVFDNTDEDKPVMTRDPKLVDGQTLPEKLGRFPKELEGIPLDEIDPYITHKVSARLVHSYCTSTY